MNTTIDKFFLKSKTVLGILVVLVMGIAPKFGFSFSHEDGAMVSSAFDAITIALGGLLTLYGRDTATTKLRFKPQVTDFLTLLVGAGMLVAFLFFSQPANAQTFPDRPNQSAEEVPRFSWLAPTLREDGKPLAVTEIGGYELYLWEVSDPEGTFQSIDIQGGATLSTSVPGLASGEYRATISAYDTDGLYSDRADEVSFTVAPGSTAPKPPSVFQVLIEKLIAFFNQLFGRMSLGVS